MLKSFLGIARKWSRENFAILAMLEFEVTDRGLFFSTHGAPLWVLRARESSYKFQKTLIIKKHKSLFEILKFVRQMDKFSCESKKFVLTLIAATRARVNFN